MTLSLVPLRNITSPFSALPSQRIWPANETMSYDCASATCVCVNTHSVVHKCTSLLYYWDNRSAVDIMANNMLRLHYPPLPPWSPRHGGGCRGRRRWSPRHGGGCRGRRWWSPLPIYPSPLPRHRGSGGRQSWATIAGNNLSSMSRFSLYFTD